jgi:hypothetical protein
VTEPVPAVAPPPRGGFGPGLALAFVAAILGALAGALIIVTTNHRIGLVPVGIGFLVGVAIERFGGGDRRLPFAGAVIALLGCLLGDLFADTHILGRDAHLSSFDVVQHHLHAVWRFYTDSFGVFEGVFYAIAAWAGFGFAQRGVRRAQAAAAANQPPSIEVPGGAGDAAAGDSAPGVEPASPLGEPPAAP